MILRLDTSTGVMYIEFNHVALWRDAYNGGSVIVMADADHFEVNVKQTAAEIEQLLKGSNAPASSPTPDCEARLAFLREYFGSPHAPDALKQAGSGESPSQGILDREVQQGSGGGENYYLRSDRDGEDFLGGY